MRFLPMHCNMCAPILFHVPIAHANASLSCTRTVHEASLSVVSVAVTCPTCPVRILEVKVVWAIAGLMLAVLLLVCGAALTCKEVARPHAVVALFSCSFAHRAEVPTERRSTPSVSASSARVRGRRLSCISPSSWPSKVRGLSDDDCRAFLVVAFMDVYSFIPQL